jgi:hypothetical protein
MDEEELPPSKFEAFAASSNDPKHGPNAVFEAGAGFWCTTGLFPQQLFISFQKSMVISRIQLVTSDIEVLEIEASPEIGEPYEMLVEHSFRSPNDANKAMRGAKKLSLQKQAFTIPFTFVKVLKFTIKKGYEDFITVRSLSIWGDKRYSES